MRQTYSKPSRWLLVLLMIIGLPGLVIAIRKYRNQPERLILSVLKRNGISEQTAKYWVAVSRFETTAWTSRVYKDSNNLFCLIIPGSKRLDYGERQTVFDSKEDAAQALYDHVIKPFKYPLSVADIDTLVAFMKSKSYFVSGLDEYKAGVKAEYKKQYGQ